MTQNKSFENKPLASVAVPVGAGEEQLPECVSLNSTSHSQWREIESYKQEVMRTLDKTLTFRDGLLLGGLGISGEAGEVTDWIKKVVYLGHPQDKQHLLEELGDVLWYVVLICIVMDFTLDEVIHSNISKLRKRYPNGFSSERSINRDS